MSGMMFKQLLGAIAVIVVMGLTQWLIAHNIYDPSQPGGKPVSSPAGSATIGCNG